MHEHVDTLIHTRCTSIPETYLLYLHTRSILEAFIQCPSQGKVADYKAILIFVWEHTYKEICTCNEYFYACIIQAHIDEHTSMCV